MPRRPDLAAVLLGRREAVQASKGTRKRSTRDLTRAQRLALAPKPPRAAALLYLRAFNGILDGLQEKIREAIFPLLPEVAGEPEARAGVVSAPDALDAQAGTRWDAVTRRDAMLTGPWAVRFGALEAAIREATTEEKLRALLTGALESLDATNAKELERVLQVSIRRGTDLAPILDGFIRDNVRLIRSVTFSQLGAVERVVTTAHAGGVRVEKLRDQIESAFGVSRSRAALIARDQVLKANADLTQVRQQRVGVTEYIWSTSRDERVRGRPGGKWEDSDSDHWSLDGTVQSWLNPPVTNEKTGERNHPGKDYQCRCVAIPVLDRVL